MTFSKMTILIIILNKVIFNLMTFRRMTFRRMTFKIMTFKRMTFKRMTFSITIHKEATMSFGKMTLSIMEQD
jgi:hypothetical protein